MIGAYNNTKRAFLHVKNPQTLEKAKNTTKKNFWERTTISYAFDGALPKNQKKVWKKWCRGNFAWQPPYKFKEISSINREKKEKKKVFDKENKEKINNKIKASKKHYIFNFCYPIEYLFTSAFWYT